MVLSASKAGNLPAPAGHRRCRHQVHRGTSLDLRRIARRGAAARRGLTRVYGLGELRRSIRPTKQTTTRAISNSRSYPPHRWDVRSVDPDVRVPVTEAGYRKRVH